MRLFAFWLAVLLSAPALAFTPDLNALADVPRHVLSPVVVKAASDEVKGAPLSIGVGVPVALDERHGHWDTPAPGVSRWRLRVYSAEAKHLSLRLDHLRLPAGGSFWVYAADGRDVQGPFSSAADSMSLPVVRATEAVLEARMPQKAQPQFRVALTHVIHGFRGLTEPATAKGQIGDAVGTCHIDVVCPDADPWRQDVQSAVLVTRLEVPLTSRPVQYICSGVMVNNVRQDDRPLALTAAHCGITENTRMSDVHVYFNVHKPRCGSTQDGPINQVIPGGQFLSRDSRSDYTLIELAGRPPSQYNVFYAGWDVRTTVSPSSGVGIHHPGGDDKKISFFSTGAQRVDNAVILAGTTAIPVDVWRVRWDRGVTEPGSSGSGLWNQDHRIVGVLSGGRSACDDATGPDLYGRLDRAWPAGLKEHLDPENTGVEVLNGKRAGNSATTLPDQGQPGPDSGGGGGGGGGAFGLLTLTLLSAFTLRRSSRLRGGV